MTIRYSINQKVNGGVIKVCLRFVRIPTDRSKMNYGASGAASVANSTS